MAGYRPKNLDELNSMFDKTMAAEKAIKKGTSLLEKSGEDILTPTLTEDIQQITDEVKQSLGLSEDINDFIAKYSPEVPQEKEEKEESRPKPQMTVITPEQPKSTFELSGATEEFEAEAPAAERETPKISRDDLMDDYARIMSDGDDDDDFPHKKLSRKEKKKLKMKEKKAAEKAQSESADNNSYDNSEAQQNIPFDSAADDEFAPPEYISAVSEAEDIQEPTVAADESFNDFSFPENYTPDWMKDDSEVVKEAPAGRKSTSGYVVLEVLLCFVLAALIFVGSAATVFKTVIPVNTGKVMNDTYYFFTAYKDYEELGIYKGDLVITEKSYAEDGAVFAYVDYSEKSFEFGMRTDSITNDDGVVLLATVKDGNRTLVPRDNCKGVLYATYPNIGGVIGFLSDNYIVVIAVVVVLILVIILVLALFIRNKLAKSNREAGSYEDSDEEAEEEEIETEEINLFSTVE